MTVLTDRDRAILTFEGQRWRFPGAKEAAIRETFDLSATRYYQHLRDLVQWRGAVEFAPEVCARVRRTMKRIPAAQPVYNRPPTSPASADPTLI